MKLPFLKNKKWPRVAKPMETKNVGPMADDALSEHCFKELKDACQSHDVKAFRSALEALIRNAFEDTDGSDEQSA